MAKWQRTLDISDAWRKQGDGEMTMHELAIVVADKLDKLLPLGDKAVDEERELIAEDFRSMAADPDTNSDDFDHTMQWLYDWADTPLDQQWNGRKACWVKTVF